MRQLQLRSLAFVFLALSPVWLFAQKPEEQAGQLLRLKFNQQVAAVVQAADAVVGVSIRDLSGNEVLMINEDEVFPLGSVIKVPILAEVLRQATAKELSLEKRLLLSPKDKVGGSGVLQHLTDPALALSVRDLSVLMIVLSDNTATNMLIDLVGMENVNSSLSSWGFEQTRLRRHMMDYAAAARGDENVGTPRELTGFLVRLKLGELLGAKQTEELFAVMRIYKEGSLRAGLAPGVALASKAGSVEAVRCEVGLVELPRQPYVISVMTKYLPEAEEGETHLGEQVIREISRLAYGYFDRIANSNVYGRRIPSQ